MPTFGKELSLTNDEEVPQPISHDYLMEIQKERGEEIIILEASFDSEKPQFCT